MEADGGNGWEALRDPLSLIANWKWMELSFSPALLTQCGTVRHAAPVTHLIQSDPKR